MGHSKALVFWFWVMGFLCKSRTQPSNKTNVNYL